MCAVSIFYFCFGHQKPVRETRCLLLEQVTANKHIGAFSSIKLYLLGLKMQRKKLMGDQNKTNKQTKNFIKARSRALS